MLSAVVQKHVSPKKIGLSIFLFVEFKIKSTFECKNVALILGERQVALSGAQGAMTT